MNITLHVIAWGAFFVVGLLLGLLIGFLSVIPGGGKRL